MVYWSTSLGEEKYALINNVTRWDKESWRWILGFWPHMQDDMKDELGGIQRLILTSHWCLTCNETSWFILVVLTYIPLISWPRHDRLTLVKDPYDHWIFVFFHWFIDAIPFGYDSLYHTHLVSLLPALGVKYCPSKLTQMIMPHSGLWRFEGIGYLELGVQWWPTPWSKELSTKIIMPFWQHMQKLWHF